MNISKISLILLATIISISLISFLTSCNNNIKNSEELSEVEKEKIIEYKYGFQIDTFALNPGEVKKNEFLTDILMRHGVRYGTIDKLARKSKDIFDVRRIKAGQKYSVIKSKDTLNDALYFVYENNPTLYTVFCLTDSLSIFQGEKTVEIVRDTVSGKIESSLWNAMGASGAPYILSVELSEIYQWTIDFFGIQKGDHFSVIYDKLYVDGEYIGIGDIYAANFNHSNYDNFAFRYIQDSLKGFDYFDEDGKSLRRTFLKAPLKFSRVSSKFSNSRMHPVLKIRRPHHGVDYAAPSGTPVFAIGDGKIIKKGYQKRGGGNYLKIKHNSVYTTVYMHLKGFAKGAKVGKHVKQGELIGYVGATGLATGPHLDYRCFKNGTAIDPLKMKSPPSNPVAKAKMNQFLKIIAPLKAGVE